MRYTIVALSCFFLMISLISCLKPTKELEPTTEVASVELIPANSMRSPEANYKEFCAGCHGAQMDAFVDRKWKYGKTDEDLFKAIKVGYEDDGMPGYEVTFSDKEINDLVDYMQKGIANVGEYYFKSKDDNPGVFSSDGVTVRLDTLASGFENPWGMTFLPNGDMLITEQRGPIYRRTNKGELIEIANAPEVLFGGQGGMLDIELHPNYKANGWIYIAFSKPHPENKNESATTIVRAKLQDNSFVDHEELFVAMPYSRKKLHFGCRIEFDREGYMFFSVGDRHNRDVNPQNLDNHCGKIHRLHDDGSIPNDNPFVNTTGAMGSIWSFGHRNPQGVAMSPIDGRIWTHEHGPRGGDEINLIEKGVNYGWPVISYGINYNGTVFTEKTEQAGMRQPNMYWLPSIGACGMTFVQSDKYPGWDNNLLSGSLRFKYLERAVIDGDEIIHTEKLLPNIGRLRAVEQGPDGYIYVIVEEPGFVFRLMPVM